MNYTLETPTIHYIAGGVVAAGLTFLAAKKLVNSRSARKEEERRKKYPVNTVILHQIGRGPCAPSLSPYPLKLETYLRMAKIPYVNEHSYEMSSKSKTPWITYNGEDLADSQFCIEFLNRKLDKDINSHLNKEERGLAYAMRKLTEESFYWTFGLERWIYNEDNYAFLHLPSPPMFIIRSIKSRLLKATHGQGYGRHTKEQVRLIGKQDLKALSDVLGTKPFLIGDEPCEEDCAVFGMLAQIKWHSPGTVHNGLITDELNNLSMYCDRMKERFWPDWDECNTAGGTKEATK